MPKIRAAFTVVAALAVATGPLAFDIATPAPASGATHQFINCRYSGTCTEVNDSEEVFGEGVYVGHDEPSTLFYSNVKGSGDSARYQIKLPTDPSPASPGTVGKSYNFELNGSWWTGMAMCDTQSYPEQVSSCTRDSDKNIVDPTVSPKHPGTAFTELQFYPPGWVQWPTFAQTIGAGSCDPTKWCVALNIDSLSRNPVTGQDQNATCQGIAGLEYINFAFITKNGKSQAPANPVQGTLTTFTPDPSKDLFMNSGDNVSVTMHDTTHGLQVVIDDLTTKQSGSMTASAANGFAQVKFAPSPSTECTPIPYDFHPMYSTSSEQTRVIWAAHTYNVGFSSEIGHFQFCNGAPIPSTEFGAPCPSGNTEESGANAEKTDGDETTACFPASRSGRVQIPGCTDQNNGFDGIDYQPVWPDGNTKLHPTSIQFTSPLTGPNFGTQYDRVAFEADLPRVEANTCVRSTGAGCTLIPTTDDNVPANFYPFFSTRNVGGDCVWQLGNHIPGSTNDFGQNAEYGTLLAPPALINGGGGASTALYNDFRQILSSNPCPSRP